MATHYGGSQNGPETVSYLDAMGEDVAYMEAKGCQAPSGETSVLQQLAAANADLLVMAGEPRPSELDLCGPHTNPRIGRLPAPDASRAPVSRPRRRHGR